MPFRKYLIVIAMKPVGIMVYLNYNISIELL